GGRRKAEGGSSRARSRCHLLPHPTSPRIRAPPVSKSHPSALAPWPLASPQRANPPIPRTHPGRFTGSGSMKITDIRTAEVKGHGYSTYVRVYTDEGLIGNGECIHGAEGCARTVRGMKRILAGEDPLNVDALWEKMRRARLFDGAMAGGTVTAMT